MSNPNHRSVTPTEIINYYQDSPISNPSPDPSPVSHSHSKSQSQYQPPSPLYSTRPNTITTTTTPPSALSRGLSRKYAVSHNSRPRTQFLQTATRADKRWEGYWLRRGTMRFDRREMRKGGGIVEEEEEEVGKERKGWRWGGSGKKVKRLERVEEYDGDGDGASLAGSEMEERRGWF